MKPLLRFLGFYHGASGFVALGIALSFVTIAANIALMALSGWFVAAMAVAGVTGIAINYFTPAAIIRALSIMRTGGRYAERVSTHNAALMVTARLRPWLFGHMEQIIPAHTESLQSGDLLSRLRGDVDALEKFYTSTIVPVCVVMLSTPLLICAWLYMLPSMALLHLALMAGVGIVIPVVLLWSGRARQKILLEETTRLRTDFTNYLQGMEEWLIYDADNGIGEILSSDIARLQSLQGRIARDAALAQGVTMALTLLAAPLALVFAVPAVAQGHIPAPYLAMLPLFAMAAFEIVAPLPAAVNAFMAGRLAAKRIYTLVDLAHSCAPDHATDPGAGFSLHLNEVNFAYPGAASILQKLTFSLKSGDVVTLQGPSGVGKTTLVHLITALRLPDAGQMTLNGYDYTELDPDDVRRHFAVAEQRPYFFAGTIRENLLRACPSATIDAIKDACMLAGIWNEIENMPDGIETYLSEGGIGLSGGQVRRLSLARALLKPETDCLILDEPGEGLDATVASNMIDRVLNAVCPAKSVLIITHQRHMVRGITLQLRSASINS